MQSFIPAYGNLLAVPNLQTSADQLRRQLYSDDEACIDIVPKHTSVVFATLSQWTLTSTPLVDRAAKYELNV